MKSWLRFTAQGMPSYTLPGRFAALQDPWMCIVNVFARLDVRSLARLLSTCKGLRNEFFVHDVEEQTAWRGLVDTELPEQITFLKACELDLKLVLHPENLRAYATAFREDDQRKYFDVVGSYASHEHRAHGAPSVFELLIRREDRQRHLRAPGDAIDWFVMRVEEGLEEFMLDMMEELGHPSTPVAVNATVIRVPEILGSSWFRDLEDDIRGQRAVAEDLKEKLGDFTDARILRRLVSPTAAQGQVASLDELIAKRAKTLQLEARKAVAKGGSTRSAKRRKMVYPDTLHLHEEVDQTQQRRDMQTAWARSRLQWMLAWSIARENQGHKRLPRLWAQVVVFGGVVDREGHGEETVPGDWKVDEQGRVQLLCRVAPGVETETRVQNCGKEVCELRVNFASHSTAAEEPDQPEVPPLALRLEEGKAGTCTFSDGRTLTSLTDDAVEDVWHIATVTGGESGKRSVHIGILDIVIRLKAQ
jgi:hypothetical protein